MAVHQKGFPSLLSLRVTHSELLKHHQVQGDDPATLQLIESFLERGIATGAVLESEEDRWIAQGFLDYWSAILYRAGQEPPEATLCEFDAHRVPVLKDDQCPYVGLHAYREAEHALFYGRQSLLRQLLQTIDTERLVLVTGASGSGKTSLVSAGLLPKLRSRTLPDRQPWLDYTLTAPSSQPFVELARLVCPNHVDRNYWVPHLTQHLKQDPSHLTKVLNQAGQGKPVILVIDQFEELFTLCQDADVRQMFIDSLQQLTQTPRPKHTVIFILQSEYESRLSEIPRFATACRQSCVQVTSPSVNELHDIITKPADLVGMKFEEGVVDALLQDTLREPDGLSLLQVILTSLWEKRARNRITWQHYRDLGRGRQALVQQAEQCFEDLSPEEQAIARQILLGLVQLGSGVNLVKRRIPRQLLTEIVEASQTSGNPEASGWVQNVEATDRAIAETSSKGERGAEKAQQLMEALFGAAEQPPAVQQHFQAMLKRKMTPHLEHQPPLFPWETTLAEYHIHESETAPYSWLAQVRSLQLPTALPHDLLAKLLNRCQMLVSESLQPGIQLVKAVEHLFPAQPQAMEQIAGLVLANATVRATPTNDAEVLKAAFPEGYEGANPQQQVTLAMLAAQNILDTLSLPVTLAKPAVQREWLTTEGKLYLKAMLVDGNNLRILGQLPCGGTMRIQNKGQSESAQRSSPGLLLIELNHPQVNQRYPLEVTLATQNGAPLIFSVSISNG